MIYSMCGIEGNRRTSDLNVTACSRPPLATRHTCAVCCWPIVQINRIYFRGYRSIYVTNKVHCTKYLAQ